MPRSAATQRGEKQLSPSTRKCIRAIMIIYRHIARMQVYLTAAIWRRRKEELYDKSGEYLQACVS